MFKQTCLVFALSSALLITGCGGGGGESAAPAAPAVELRFEQDLPSQLTIKEGQSTQLDIQVLAPVSSLVEIDWYLNDQKIDLTDPRVTTLQIPNATASSQGRYYAIAREINSAKRQIRSKTVQLTVESLPAKPTFKEPKIEFDVAIDDDVLLNPAASGFPVPTYQWYKDGKILTGKTQATLAFPKVQEADAGIYHVIAKNSLGETKSPEYKINVEVQLATGVWLGQIDGRDAVVTIAPDGKFTLSAFTNLDGSTWYTSGTVRTVSPTKERGGLIKFHPATSLPVLSYASSQSVPVLQEFSLGAGIAWSYQRTIVSNFAQLTTELSTGGITFPQTRFVDIDLKYDGFISNLVSLPKDMAGTWQIKNPDGSLYDDISISESGELTGIFAGVCRVKNGTVLPVNKSKTLYRVQYELLSITSGSCPIAASFPQLTGFAFRVPTDTGDYRLYMEAQWLVDGVPYAADVGILERR